MENSELVKLALQNRDEEIKEAEYDRAMAWRTMASRLQDQQTMSSMVLDFHKKQRLDIGLNIEHHGQEYSAIERMFVMDEEYAEMKKELLVGSSKQKLAHELADLIYTIVGTAICFGIEIEPVFAAVHKANMTKGKGFDKTNYVPPEIGV